MIRRTSLLLVGLSAAAFVGGLVGSLTTRSIGAAVEPPPPADAPLLRRCLGVSEERMAEIESRDPTFRADLAALRAELAERRAALADSLESADSTDEQIRERLEQTITTHNALERRVTEYLILVRPLLDPEQKSRLFRLLADGVRAGPAGGWGGGAGLGRGRGGPGGGGGFGGGRGGGGPGGRGGPPWAEERDSGGDEPAGDAGRPGPGRGFGRGGGGGRGGNSTLDVPVKGSSEE